MDLETELHEEQKKDEESIKDTLNECKNEVGNISSEVSNISHLRPFYSCLQRVKLVIFDR